MSLTDSPLTVEDWGQGAVSGDKVLMDGWRWVLGRDWVAEVREPDNCRPPPLKADLPRLGVSTVHVALVLTDSPLGRTKKQALGNYLHWELFPRPWC